MHRSNAELQWYLRHEWERRLRRADWGSRPTAPPPGAAPWPWRRAAVNVLPVVNTVRATLSHQAALAGADPAVAAAVSQVIEALGPALRLAAMELAEQAAAEVRAQLPGHTVDVVVVDGDPTLRVAERVRPPRPRQAEDFVSRLRCACRRRSRSWSRAPPTAQNLRLLASTRRRLTECGFRVLQHERVPPNDGGISYGQAAVAAARWRATPGARNAMVTACTRSTPSAVPSGVTSCASCRLRR